MIRTATLRFAESVLRRVPFPGRYVVANAAGRWLAPSAGIVAGRNDSLRMEFDLHDEIQRQMFFGLYDRPLTRLLKARLQAGAVFYDVGANVGYFTMLASGLVGQDGEVHAFEPIAANSGRIARNIAINRSRNVILNEFAVSDAPGTIELYVAAEITNSGWASVVPSPRRPEKRSVATRDLDGYVLDDGRRRPDVIKLDIEGAEPRALAGMGRLLAAAKAPDLVVEVNPFLLEREGLSPSAILDPLKVAGYRLWRLTNRGVLPLAEQEPLTVLTDLYATKRSGSVPQW